MSKMKKSTVLGKINYDDQNLLLTSVMESPMVGTETVSFSNTTLVAETNPRLGNVTRFDAVAARAIRAKIGRLLDANIFGRYIDPLA